MKPNGKKIKEKKVSQLRVPKVKTKRFGLQVPVIRMPHEDLIKPEQKRFEIVSNDKATLTTQSSQSSQSSFMDSPASKKTFNKEPTQNRQTEIAPVKNFQKVANSISKQAIPEGWFRGKSKQLYDALYSLTRGAIVPTRKVRVQKSQIMKLAGIGSRKTFDANIENLINVGLVIEVVFSGEHQGNEFEIFLPDEITQSSQSSQSDYAPKVVRVVTPESSQSSHSLNDSEITVYGKDNTLLKTNTNDDDMFANFGAKFDTVSRKLTGKGISKKDAEKWGAVADIIILELEIAASRAETVSSVPAFLTEVLRRRFFAVRQSERTQLGKVSKTVSKITPDTIGKPEAEESFAIKPLDEAEREEALSQLQEFADDDFLPDFEKWYVSEDWQWLMTKLGKSPREEVENRTTEDL